MTNWTHATICLTPEEKTLFAKKAKEARQSISGFFVKSALERIERQESKKKRKADLFEADIEESL